MIASRLWCGCTPVGTLFDLPLNGKRVQFRESVFYNAYEALGLDGSDYIADSFRWAREAEPWASATSFWMTARTDRENVRNGAAFSPTLRAAMPTTIAITRICRTLNVGEEATAPSSPCAAT